MGRNRSSVISALVKKARKKPEIVVEALSAKFVRELQRSTPPFQTENYEYAKLANARVLENSIKPSGILSLFNGKLVIEVKRSETFERKNWTVCHEVGHIAIRRAANVLVAQDDGRYVAWNSKRKDNSILPSSKEEERLADSFAANLLMPKAAYETFVADYKQSLPNLFVIAKAFRVSPTAAIKRIVELKLWKCDVLWCVPEKMARGEWAIKILERKNQAKPTHFEYCSEYVRWGVEHIKSAYDCPSGSVSSGTITLENRTKTLEAVKRYSRGPNGEWNSVVLVLLSTQRV